MYYLSVIILHRFRIPDIVLEPTLSEVQSTIDEISEELAYVTKGKSKVYQVFIQWGSIVMF